MKKMLLIATIISILLFQNIASAADFLSVDWDNVPEISNKTDFVDYVLKCENNCQEVIPLVCTEGFFVNLEEFLRIAKNAQHAKITWLDNEEENYALVLYEIKIYPGAKVAYAFSTGDISILTVDEMQLYNEAVKIVEKVNCNNPSELQKELLIHDEITRRASYIDVEFGDEILRSCNAFGALLDGQANCQGYADAFYMLGTMCGFNVGKIQGTTNGVSHVWNTIELDGKYYGVDVTWDDASFKMNDGREYNNYIYFNAPLEIMQVRHKWDSAYAPALQSTIDNKYFYKAREFSGLH